MCDGVRSNNCGVGVRFAMNVAVGVAVVDVSLPFVEFGGAVVMLEIIVVEVFGAAVVVVDVVVGGLMNVLLTERLRVFVGSHLAASTALRPSTKVAEENELTKYFGGIPCIFSPNLLQGTGPTANCRF